MTCKRKVTVKICTANFQAKCIALTFLLSVYLLMHIERDSDKKKTLLRQRQGIKYNLTPFDRFLTQRNHITSYLVWRPSVRLFLDYFELFISFTTAVKSTAAAAADETTGRAQQQNTRKGSSSSACVQGRPGYKHQGKYER